MFYSINTHCSTPIQTFQNCSTLPILTVKLFQDCLTLQILTVVLFQKCSTLSVPVLLKTNEPYKHRYLKLTIVNPTIDNVELESFIAPLQGISVEKKIKRNNKN